MGNGVVVVVTATSDGPEGGLVVVEVLVDTGGVVLVVDGVVEDSDGLQVVARWTAVVLAVTRLDVVTGLLVVTDVVKDRFSRADRNPNFSATHRVLTSSGLSLQNFALFYTNGKDGYYLFITTNQGCWFILCLDHI